MQSHASLHEIILARRASELSGGDILFLVSCHEIIRRPVRDLFRYTLVLHASALPTGKGMSPHIWQILEGKNPITLSMINAEDQLDAGDIWQQRRMFFEGHELYDEINARVFDAEIELMSWAIENIDNRKPSPQEGEGSYYRKRTPADSRIDPEKSIESQFNLLRVADPIRYPAFFELHGHKYKIAIEKI
jgi:methionyl-tRNA formyltransferase